MEKIVRMEKDPIPMDQLQNRSMSEPSNSLDRDHGEEAREIDRLKRELHEIRQKLRDSQELQVQLRQAQKIDALGTLACGIAHDFNNLLTAILGSAEHAKKTLPRPHPAVQSIEVIEQAVRQASDVTHALLTFSSRKVFAKAPIELCEVVLNSSRLLQRILPASVDIVTETPEGVHLWVHSGATQLQQILMNLAVNARDAMQEGGALRIVIERERGPEGDWAVMEVEDSGSGMSEEIRARAFEPFFSTKPRGSGTGLGLSVIHGIVRDHGGTIEMESELGRGTRVTIRLPCCDPPEPTPDASTARLRIGIAKGELIILAEDDPYVRSIIATSLGAAGYVVMQSPDGKQTLEAFEKHRAITRLIILDSDLPKKSGRDCGRIIHEARPDLPLIMISGNLEFELDDPDRSNPALLRKPFQMNELKALVFRMLNRGEPSEGGV